MRKQLLATALCVAIAACGDGQPPDGDDMAVSKAGQRPDLDSGDTGSGAGRESASLGQVDYSWDPAVLHRTEVSALIPPEHEREETGIKLIPAERAALLGEERCSYGESGMVTACNAEQEAGLEIVRLDRPLAYWRNEFAESIIGAGSLEPVEIGRVEGFRFTAQVEGSGAVYNFLPAGNSTVLVTRRFRYGHDEGEEEVARVMEGLRISS